MTYVVQIYSPHKEVSAQEIRISGELPEYVQTSEWTVDAPGEVQAIESVFEESQSDPTDWVVLGEVARVGDSWYLCDVLGWSLLDGAPPLLVAPKRHLSLVK